MTSPDLSSVLGALTPAQQDAIRALIAQEAAKNAPPPPRVLTPAEQADLYLTQARRSLGGEGMNQTAAEIVYHDRVLSLLSLLVDATYPPAPIASESAPVVADTSSITESGAA